MKIQRSEMGERIMNARCSLGARTYIRRVSDREKSDLASLKSEKKILFSMFRYSRPTYRFIDSRALGVPVQTHTLTLESERKERKERGADLAQGYEVSL